MMQPPSSPPLPSIVCFGEMLLRYSPAGDGGVRGATAFAVRAGGAEANVAIALASLGHPARMATILPDNALGDRALDTLAAHNVETTHCMRSAGRMGAFFIESPRGGREGGFFYDRGDSAFCHAGAEAIDWPRALAGAGWLHISGITAALGDGAVGQLRRAVAAADALGVTISFDCNYRPSLWHGREAPALLREFASSARLIFASEADEALLAGEAGGMLAAFDRAAIIATTLRGPDGERPMLGARVKTRDGVQDVEAVPIEPYVDRIGAGDAFAAGMLFGLASGWKLPRVARFAHRLCVMKHAIPGDFSMLTAAEVMAA